MNIFSFIAILFLACAAPALADNSVPFELSYTDAEAAVAQALVDKGVGKKLAATITGHRNKALYAYSKPVTAEIHGLNFDKPSGRWNASLLALCEGSVVTAMPIGGRFEEIVSVPVLKRAVRNGDVISQDDIDLRDFTVARTRSDTITDAEKLIGKSPARSLSPNRPIREHEIASPALVRKNGIVQIRFTSPGIEITTTGQAMDDGSKGSMIAVRNLASKKIIRAVVEDENTVSIIASGEKYAAN